MDDPTKNPSSDLLLPCPSSSPAAAADSRWVILNCYGCYGNDETSKDRVVVANSLAAESRTSTGRHFRVSIQLAPPPAFSYLRHALLLGSTAPSASSSAVDNTAEYYSQVVAAHGDTVLFAMSTIHDGGDYFVYTAAGGHGGGSSALPRLTLVPWLNDDNRVHGFIGLLRCGEDEILVAQLSVPFGEPARDTAELSVLRLRLDGGGDGGGWELKKAAVPIIVQAGGHVLRNWWEIVAVVPVRDRYLCWVNYLTGILVCDMAAGRRHDRKLRYVRMPADLVGDDDEEANEEYTSTNDDPPSMKHCRNMCAAAAGSSAAAVRLVSVDSRCCCGGPGYSTCKRSRYAFTVTTWTLQLTTTGTDDEEPMRWVRDGVLDCDELWALPEYGSSGLPRVPLRYPVVSSDDPDVVCFRVRDDYDGYRQDAKEWLLEVDTRRKRLRSVLPNIPATMPHLEADSDKIQAEFHY